MILVTGGAGLVGRQLITQLLAKGQTVKAIYNKTPLPDFNSPLLQQYHCSILDVVGLEELMEDTTQVYHCAGLVTFKPSRRNELQKINVEGTANIVNAALQNGVKKLVHVSSVSALGRIRNNATVNETMNWSEETSNSNYGQSKFLGELEVWRGIGEGLQAVIVNPSTIIGPGNWEMSSAQIFKSAYNEFPWYAEGINGFVDVRDVAKAMIDLMESDINAERFIISAENRSYKEIFETAAKYFNKKPPHKKVTPFLASIVWRLEAIKSMFTGKDPLVTKETSATALSSVYFDSSKLKKFLPGFEYRSIEDAIAFTCKQFEEAKNKQ